MAMNIQILSQAPDEAAAAQALAALQQSEGFLRGRVVAPTAAKRRWAAQAWFDPMGAEPGAPLAEGMRWVIDLGAAP